MIGEVWKRCGRGRYDETCEGFKSVLMVGQLTSELRSIRSMEQRVSAVRTRGLFTSGLGHRQRHNMVALGCFRRGLFLGSPITTCSYCEGSVVKRHCFVPCLCLSCAVSFLPTPPVLGLSVSSFIASHSNSPQTCEMAKQPGIEGKPTARISIIVAHES